MDPKDPNFSSQQIQFLLKNLNDTSNKHSKRSKAIARFRNFVERVRPDFFDDDIDLLFLGSDKYRGLLHWCGHGSSEKHQGALKRTAKDAIALVRWLLLEQPEQVETQMLVQFRHLPVDGYRQMNLHKHIAAPRHLVKSGRGGSKQDALEVLVEILQNHKSPSGERDPLDAKLLLPEDHEAHGMYKNWIGSEVGILSTISKSVSPTNFYDGEEDLDDDDDEDVDYDGDDDEIDQVTGTSKEDAQEVDADLPKNLPLRWDQVDLTQFDVNFHNPAAALEMIQKEEKKVKVETAKALDPLGILTDTDLRTIDVRKALVRSAKAKMLMASKKELAVKAFQESKKEAYHGESPNSLGSTPPSDSALALPKQVERRQSLLGANRLRRRASNVADRKKNSNRNRTRRDADKNHELLDFVYKGKSILTGDPDFNPILFLNLVHGDCPVPILLQGYHHLKSDVTTKSSQLQKLLTENFSTFVGSIDCVDQFKKSIEDEVIAAKENGYAEGDGHICKLEFLSKSSQNEAKVSFSKILDSMETMTKVKAAQGLLRRLELLIGVPALMKEAMAAKDYAQVVDLYGRVRICSGMPILRGVSHEARQIAKECGHELLSHLKSKDYSIDGMISEMSYIKQLDITGIDVPIFYYGYGRQMELFEQELDAARERFQSGTSSVDVEDTRDSGGSVSSGGPFSDRDLDHDEWGGADLNEGVLGGQLSDLDFWEVGVYDKEEAAIFGEVLSNRDEDSDSSSVFSDSDSESDNLPSLPSAPQAKPSHTPGTAKFFSPQSKQPEKEEREEDTTSGDEMARVKLAQQIARTLLYWLPRSGELLKLMEEGNYGHFEQMQFMRLHHSRHHMPRQSVHSSMELGKELERKEEQYKEEARSHFTKCISKAGRFLEAAVLGNKLNRLKDPSDDFSSSDTMPERSSANTGYIMKLFSSKGRSESRSREETREKLDQSLPYIFFVHPGEWRKNTLQVMEWIANKGLRVSTKPLSASLCLVEAAFAQKTLAHEASGMERLREEETWTPLRPGESPVVGGTRLASVFATRMEQVVERLSAGIFNKIHCNSAIWEGVGKCVEAFLAVLLGLTEESSSSFGGDLPGLSQRTLLVLGNIQNLEGHYLPEIEKYIDSNGFVKTSTDLLCNDKMNDTRNTVLQKYLELKSAEFKRSVQRLWSPPPPQKQGIEAEKQLSHAMVVKILLGLVRIQTEARSALGNTMYQADDDRIIETYKHILYACAERIGELLVREAQVKLVTDKTKAELTLETKRHCCAQVQFFHSALEGLVPNHTITSLKDIVVLLQHDQDDRKQNGNSTEEKLRTSREVHRMLRECHVYLVCFHEKTHLQQTTEEQTLEEEDDSSEDGSDEGFGTNPFDVVRKMGQRRSIAENVVL